MHMLNYNQQVPVYPFEPDEAAGNKYFRVHNYEGSLPNMSDLLVPHRKDHYLIVFIRRAGGRQWIDTTPYILKDNTIYFTGPNQIIVKEEFRQLWSTGIAFTREFLSFQENAALSKLPLIQNPQGGHELLLTEADINFVEDMLARINVEYPVSMQRYLPLQQAVTSAFRRIGLFLRKAAKDLRGDRYCGHYQCNTFQPQTVKEESSQQEHGRSEHCQSGQRKSMSGIRRCKYSP